MKKFVLIPILYFIIFQTWSQSLLPKMTVELWSEDIEYLNKKIQKEFNSFIPGLKTRFDSEAQLLIKRLPNLKYHQVACEIQRIMSLLNDGHTELNIGHKSVGFHRVPLVLYFFESELYVLAAHKEFKHLVGTKIIGIGNETMIDAFGRLKKNMSSDNEMEYIHAAPGYLILTELLAHLGVSSNKEEVTIEIEFSEGKKEKLTFEGLDFQSYQEGEWISLHEINQVEKPLYLSKRKLSYWYQFFPESNTMYFNFARVNNQKGQASIKKVIKQLFKEIDLLKPDKFVIDFRLNNGGNYNLSRPLIEAIKARDWLNQKGKVWAISGRRTFSAAMVACVFLKQETQAQLIGEAGRAHPNRSDNNEYLTLPNSRFLIEYTTKVKLHWPEKQNLDRVSVDIEMAPTFKSYAQGKDHVLEYLLSK